MFCLSCGKKIAEKSKFCKYCGERVGSEEIVNKKIFHLNSFRNFWAILWVVTMVVFVLHLIIFAKFDELNINLFNNDLLVVFFFSNIVIGVVSFIFIFFTRIIPKKPVPKFIKFGLFFLLGYLIICPGVLAIEGYRANTNNEYKNKYYSNQEKIPTPIPQDSVEKLLKDLNDYRSEQKNSVVVLDEEMCKVAERLVKKGDLKGALKNSDYIDLCPKCNGVGYAYVEDFPLNNVFPKFKEFAETKKIIDTKNYKYACFAINGQKVLLFIGNKNSSSKTTNTITNNNSDKIECIGPDGKNFWTTMDECKKLNEKWGKPVNYMVNCNYPAECGGGTKRESKSECDKPCTRINNNNNNNNNQVIYVPLNNTPASNKTAVFLTYGQYTIYCPPQNVGAVMTIDSTMKSKSMEWAKNYNDCADRFRNSDGCWSACKTSHTNGWNQCTATYGYSGSEKDSCTNKTNDEYGVCISKCPSPSSACDYVYVEQKNLSSQITNLCR